MNSIVDTDKMTSAATSAPDGSPRPVNLFDFLRILGAVFVIWGHAHSLTGVPAPGWFGNPIGTLGVKMFFVISGLLITRSWIADPRPWPFAQRRILRIMPGLILVTVAGAYILGPFVTTLPLKDYISSSGARFYLRNALLFPVYSLPGVFAANPYPLAVNGSLWSLPAEVLMYIFTPFIIGRSVHIAKWSVAIVALLSMVAGIYFNRIAAMTPQPVFYGTSVPQVLEVMAYFQIGSLCAVYKLERFARPGFSSGLLIICAMALKAAETRSNVSLLDEIMLLFLLPFAVISVGEVTLSGAAARILSLGDISYGLYLYGFPVEQLISYLYGGHIGPRHNFVLSLPLTALLAVISWKAVEQPALRFKPRSSGRHKANPASSLDNPGPDTIVR